LPRRATSYASRRRGSTAGYKPTPFLKLSTNTPMYERMAKDMDIDGGMIVAGDETLEEA
jgi:altronate dehydratase